MEPKEGKTFRDFPSAKAMSECRFVGDPSLNLKWRTMLLSAKGMINDIKETVYSDSDAVGISLSGRRRVLEMLPPQHHRHLQRRLFQYNKIIKQARQLNRKKDIVCLILSYPPLNLVNKERHSGWVLDVLKINQKLREMKALPKKKEINDLELSSQITRLLDHSIDDIEALVPGKIIKKMCNNPQFYFSFKNTTNPRETMLTMPPKVLTLAVDFAVRQILENMENPRVLWIGISGNDAIKVTERLSSQPFIKKKFDIMFQVDVKSCTTIRDIEKEIAMQFGLPNIRRQKIDELLRSSNFLILLNDVHEWINLYELGTNWHNSKHIQKIVSTTQFENVHDMKAVDLEIRMEDHILPWELFLKNSGKAADAPRIRGLAIQVVKECHGHLLATLLMARSLKDVGDVRIWEYASHAVSLHRSTSPMEDKTLFNVLAFICGQLGSKSYFVKHCALYLEKKGAYKVHLIQEWINDSLIGTLDEGEEIIQDLINAFLLETFGNGESVRMRNEIRQELVNLFESEMSPMVLWQGGKGLTEAPKDTEWETTREMHLMNNKLSKLPENPNCPHLNVLFLQVNPHLRVIPPLFFQSMHVLQILDLSHTRVRSLPQSISRLVQLQKFLLRSCELLVQLPPEVGDLSNLKVLDLEGTEITNLPADIGRLTKLTCLRVSFCGYTTSSRKNNQQKIMIPENVISNLCQLEELSIDVNPDDELWNATVQDVVKEVCKLKRLEAVKLYLPDQEVLLFDLMQNGQGRERNFRYIVGNLGRRIISRLPCDLAVKFEQQERCLKYANGDGIIPWEIKYALHYATAFFLDRHLGITKLSELGTANMTSLELCILNECNEMQTIVDGSEIHKEEDARGEIPLGSLQYLSIHYMKNLGSIWKGPLQRGCLSRLMSLTLHTCPILTTVFSFGLLQNLNNLEELMVEDCPEICSIVMHEVPPEDLRSLISYLPKLKKISLHYLPKLTSISSGLWIAPKLEWMSTYGCPCLNHLSENEVSSKNLKVIIGEADWWSSLRWSKGESTRPDNLDYIFVPVEYNTDLMTQLAEINNQIQG